MPQECVAECRDLRNEECFKSQSGHLKCSVYSQADGRTAKTRGNKGEHFSLGLPPDGRRRKYTSRAGSAPRRTGIVRS